MSEGFGARLRRQREAHGIALHTIAGETKIKVSLLEGLERDDVSQWPSGIFRRAYIRSYAQAIGLDPDAVAGEFLETYPDPGGVVTTDAIAAAVDGTRASTAPPTRLRYIVGSALGSLTRRRRTPDAAPPAEAVEAVSFVTAPHHEPDLPLVVDLFSEPAPAERPLDAACVDTPDDGAVAADMGLEEIPFPAAEREEPHPNSDTVTTAEVVEEPRSVVAPHSIDFDLGALAALCTELGRAGSPHAVQSSLEQAAVLLDASGLIVWLWDGWAGGLRPALVHGYSDAVVAQLPVVGSNADNATAAAFRSARPCAIDGGPHDSDALVVPLLTSGGCAGVLAIELPRGRARLTPVRAAATILAAQLAPLVGSAGHDESGSQDASGVSADEALTGP